MTFNGNIFFTKLYQNPSSQVENDQQVLQQMLPPRMLVRLSLDMKTDVVKRYQCGEHFVDISCLPGLHPLTVRIVITNAAKVQKAIDNTSVSWDEIIPATMYGVWKIWPDCVHGFCGFENGPDIQMQVVELVTEAGSRKWTRLIWMNCWSLMGKICQINT